MVIHGRGGRTRQTKAGRQAEAKSQFKVKDTKQSQTRATVGTKGHPLTENHSREDLVQKAPRVWLK